MRASVRLLSLLSLLPLMACRASPPAPAGATGGPSAAAQAAEPPAPPEKIGVFAPLDAAAIALWPEEYGGSWLVLEVLPQGTLVQEGEAIARLDTRAIDSELHRAELELQSSTVSHQATLEKNRLEDEAARSALERTRAALARAQRSLAGWKEQELAFASRSDELGKRYEEANVEDQTDELDQLQKMYKADELVDATEDIVIKRSQRALALTKSQNGLSRDRARYHQELELALQTEQREEEVRAQVEALARLEQQQAIEARSRQDAELRSADALAEQQKKLERLRRDRELFVVKAPRAGLLLHGDPREYRPGKSPARQERGSQLATRASVFAIADPEPAAVAFDLNDSELVHFAEGARVEARPIDGAAGAGGSVPGTVHVEAYARSLSAEETRLEASARLEQPCAGARYGQRARITSAGTQARAQG